MTKRIAFAPLTIFGALAVVTIPAHAQAPLDLAAAPAMAGNVVGGGGASISGGDLDRVITYSGSGAGGGARYEQLGRTATFAGNSGGNPSWTYGNAPAPTGGREAWLVGGADDAQVVYLNPAGARRR